MFIFSYCCTYNFYWMIFYIIFHLLLTKYFSSLWKNQFITFNWSKVTNTFNFHKSSFRLLKHLFMKNFYIF